MLKINNQGRRLTANFVVSRCVVIAAISFSSFGYGQQVGATRNADNEGNMLPSGQEMVYTGPSRGWQIRKSAAELERQAALEKKWEQERRDAAEANTNGPNGYMTRLRDMERRNAPSYSANTGGAARNGVGGINGGYWTKDQFGTMVMSNSCFWTKDVFGTSVQSAGCR